MSLPKPSRSFVRQLLRLLDGETLNASAFGNRRLLDKMIEDRVLVRTVTGRGRSKISCPNPESLENHLRLQFGITDLEAYFNLLGQDVRDGEESLKAARSTKTLRTASLQGFFIKAFGTGISIGGSRLGLLPAGAEYFLSDFSALEIQPEAMVVGVENPECFQKAARLLHLFPDGPLVFVLRFYSNALLSWLESVGNPYLHFGDFDPAGIGIYCNEYLKRLGEGRCRFFVPENVETLIAGGQSELFDRQQSGWPPQGGIEQPDLLRLIDLINRYGKGVEQECLLG